MSDANAQRFDPLGASLLLAGGMCLIPFLQPRHYPPLRSFYDEWLAFALGLAAVALAAAARREALVRIPALSLWLAAFALFLPLRAFVTQPAYVQSSLIWALYALFAASLVALGHVLAMQLERERVCDVLAAFVLFGALANAGVAVLQVTGIPQPIDAFVAHLQGARAVGNVGQANLFANYLALGEASLLYLFARRKVQGPAALAAALVLLASAALADSRTSLLYAVCFALLGALVLRRTREAPMRRLGRTAVALAIGALVLQWVVPAGLAALGSRHAGALDPGATSQLRLLAWQLAWQLFAADPWLGVGPGEFAGAGFARGLPPEMASEGIWTSPHNVILQLLCQTGLFGAALIAAGLLAWLWRSSAELWRTPSLALWWVAACCGVEFTHALLESPFAYAHFLGVTALVMGVGTSGRAAPRIPAVRAIAAVSAVAGAALLAGTLKDYFRFDAASLVSAGRSLAPESEVLRERATLRELSGGLLAPSTEPWLFLALPLDANDLDGKLAIGARVLRTWPSSHVVARQSVFLALAGRNREALALLARGRETYTQSERRAEIGAVVAGAPSAARSILQPVLRQ